MLCFIWILRFVASFKAGCYGRFMTSGKRREADTQYSTYEKQLMQRGFQTGDILVTGSDIFGPSSFIAQCTTVTPFGHVAVLLRNPDPRLRAAFGLATIISKLGFFMKGEIASMIKPEYRKGNWDKLGRGEKCRRLALITAKALSKQDLRLARRNEFEGGGRLFLRFISRHLDLKDGKPLEQRDMFQRWLQKYVFAKMCSNFFELNQLKQNRYDSGKIVRFGMNKGQKRYVRWMRRSTCGVYAIEAIGTGTRMMPLERFFKFWWRNRRERIAWRPLYCVSSTPEKRHDLTFQAGIDLVGQRYVSLLELILVAIRTNLTSRPDSNYEDLSKTVRRRFFCSEFTTAALKRMKLIEEKSIVDGHVQPGDYGSDYGEYV